MQSYQKLNTKAEAYRQWRKATKPNLSLIARRVGVASAGSLNTTLNRPSMNPKLRQRCIEEGIPEAVLPSPTRTKAELEAELMEAKAQLTMCWDALAASRIAP